MSPECLEHEEPHDHPRAVPESGRQFRMWSVVRCAGTSNQGVLRLDGTDKTTRVTVFPTGIASSSEHSQNASTACACTPPMWDARCLTREHRFVAGGPRLRGYLPRGAARRRRRTPVRGLTGSCFLQRDRRDPPGSVFPHARVSVPVRNAHVLAPSLAARADDSSGRWPVDKPLLCMRRTRRRATERASAQIDGLISWRRERPSAIARGGGAIVERTRNGAGST